MSFIYEALKRAEDDNQQRVTAPLRHDGGSAPTRGRSRRWMWALIGVLAANALVIGAWTLVRGPRSTDEARVMARAALAPGIAVPSVTVTATPPDAAPPLAMIATEPQAPSAVSPPSPSPTVVAPATPPVSAATPVVTPAPSRRAEPSPPSPRLVIVPPPPGPLPSPVPVPSAAPMASAATPPVAPTPLATSQPRVVRAPVTTPADRTTVAPAPAAPADPSAITLQVLVYSETASQRMVFIGGRRYMEGESVDADTVLERINSDGAVFRRRGQRFVVSDRK